VDSGTIRSCLTKLRATKHILSVQIHRALQKYFFKLEYSTNFVIAGTPLLVYPVVPIIKVKRRFLVREVVIELRPHNIMRIWVNLDQRGIELERP
jgi:hypothetical protein